eukprot:Lithocolla_globosa_v1_NODE_87_length_6640_cov_111.536826.p5 type:complete len:204 gc:universal NODE_87_length_6640_cov_111.536826:2532-1921(-)
MKLNLTLSQLRQRSRPLSIQSVDENDVDLIPKEIYLNEKISHRHHSSSKAGNQRVYRDVKKFLETMRENGNPFAEMYPALMVLKTGECLPKEVENSYRTLESIGKKQHMEYLQKVVIDRTQTVQTPIKRNNLRLFDSPTKKKRSKKILQIQSLKQDVSLFSKLFIVNQIREGNLDDFFQYDNASCPPSLSENGKLRFGTKVNF